VREGTGDTKWAEAAARSLEGEKVDLIVTITTSVTVAVKRATTSVPIVFCAGADPVSAGLVESYRKPGGRLTGIHYQGASLTAKRLELLKGVMPTLRRVVSFYNPDNLSARQSVKLAREAARLLKVELIERPVRTTEDLQAGLRALRPGEADAFLYVSDAMVASQTELIIEVGRAKRMPAMFQDRWSIDRGALAAYENHATIGRLSARHVQRILAGAIPGELPVEQVDRFHFVVNLKTAKAFGLTIPPLVLGRADEVIE
jgi:putative ABC transport system substrate-binding protein